MECFKNKKRNLFYLFEIYSCENCNNEIDYKYIYIGNNIINIYYLNNECVNDVKKQKMIKLFFKECIINLDDIFVVLNKEEYYKYFDLLPLLIEFNNDLYVLVL